MEMNIIFFVEYVKDTFIVTIIMSLFLCYSVLYFVFIAIVDFNQHLIIVFKVTS